MERKDFHHEMEQDVTEDWGLYIGGLREAQDVESLRAHGIGAVVNAAPDVVHAAC